MNCPSCQAACTDGSTSCPACGLVYAHHAAVARSRRAQEAKRAQAGARRARRNGAVAVFAALVVAVVVLKWTSGPSAQAFVVPADGGRVFAGVAHDYAGEAADLFLLKGVGQTVQKIGQIGSDGRFEFELPAKLELSRLTSMLEVRRRNMGSPGEGNARLREQIARWTAKPESAVHALNAGEAWSELTVEPLELNAARYAVAYANASEYGHLFIANGRMRVVATPGQAMVVVVYADRAGRVRGVAQTMNAFGVTVPYTWDLDLQAGWNLVTSEQTADMTTLRYRTGELPDNLEWWTVEGR
jgi:hypothetical protein